MSLLDGFEVELAFIVLQLFHTVHTVLFLVLCPCLSFRPLSFGFPFSFRWWVPSRCPPSLMSLWYGYFSVAPCVRMLFNTSCSSLQNVCTLKNL